MIKNLRTVVRGRVHGGRPHGRPTLHPMDVQVLRQSNREREPEMKKNVLIFCIIASTSSVFALRKDPEYRNARRDGAMAEIRLCVIDDMGWAVTNASVRVVMDMPTGEYSLFGKTDTNGVYVAKGKTNGNYVEFLVGKDGYYGSRKKIIFAKMGAEHDVKDGKWQPYGEKMSILLKPIKNPFELCSVPVKDYKFTDTICKWIGYDLEKNDFVKPYGAGTVSDFEVYLDWDRVYSIMDCKQAGYKIRFAEPWSGYCPMQIDAESEFPTPYNAVTNATFLKEAEFYDRYEGERVRNTFDKSKCWVIRSRCKIDEHGRLISANYSVARLLGMSGNRELKAGFGFVGAFNPTPNDTNLEDVATAERSRHFIRQCEPPPPPTKKKRKSLWPF